MEADSRRSVFLSLEDQLENEQADTSSEQQEADDNKNIPSVPTVSLKEFQGPLDVKRYIQLLLAAFGGTLGFCSAAFASFMLLGLVVFPNADQEVPKRRVAFLGNSMIFVNDLPRFVEALSSNKIEQNSCLHGSLNFKTQMSRGNGMYNKWQTENALLEVIQVETDDDVYYTDDETAGETVEHNVYDFGACSFPQLLFGYDAALSNGNENSFYSDDGMNPCFEDPYYLDYLNAQYEASSSKNKPPSWNYVVLNDQTTYPGIVRKRKRSIRVLRQVYADLLRETAGKPTPIFLSTYGYDKDLYADTDDDDDANSADDDDNNNNNNNYNNYNNNNLGDIPEMTSRVWYGYQQYAAVLKELLPPSQRPIIVPTGLAFLTLWEENYDMWITLFQDDGFHPSPHGTFLMGCCLYATLYNRLPSSTKWSSDLAVERLFQHVRGFQMASMGEDRPIPTAAEAGYLASVAERVALRGYVPTSLLTTAQVAALEASEAN